MADESKMPAAAGNAVPASWYEGFKDTSLKGWLANKHYESPEVLVSAHWSLEKLMGHDRAGRTVVVPGETATPEERATFLAKLGRPDTLERGLCPA